MENKPRIKEFSLKQFLAFSSVKQHKEIAQALRYDPDRGHIYLKALNLPLPQTKKERADAYHYHLEQAGISLREKDFLPFVHTQDKVTKSPDLTVDILLDNIRSAHNVGSIIRTTEAFSLGTLHFYGMTPHPTHKKVKDTAMGAEEWVTWREADLLELKRPFIALETAEDAKPLETFCFPESFTLIIGNEEYGISDEVLSQAEYFVKIPLCGRKNSLNVANAFSIAADSLRRHIGNIPNESRPYT